MGLEVEARFRASGPAPLEHLAAEPTLGHATLGPARTVHEEDRYLDTHDGRLRDARWACRLRRREGEIRISLKGPPDRPTAGWLHARPEVEGPATAAIDPHGWPASPARELLLDLSRGAPLAEWLRLLQERTERTVSVGERLIGGLSLDAVVARRGGERLGELYLVELEIEDGGDPHRDLEALADALAARAGLAPEALTKLELALALDPSRAS